MMTQERPTNSERLARVEALLAVSDREILRNGTMTVDGLAALSDKLDSLDAKWDARFTRLEQEHLRSDKELQSFKNKGLGVLAALGFVFTAAATVFAAAFTKLNAFIFG